MERSRILRIRKEKELRARLREGEAPQDRGEEERPFFGTEM